MEICLTVFGLTFMFGSNYGNKPLASSPAPCCFIEVGYFVNFYFFKFGAKPRIAHSAIKDTQIISKTCTPVVICNFSFLAFLLTPLFSLDIIFKMV